MKRQYKLAALFILLIVPSAYYLSMQRNKGEKTDKYYKVPVLCYHNLSQRDTKGRYTIKPETFETHLKILKDNQIDVISLYKLYTHLQTGKFFQKKSVVITIDDGFASLKNYCIPLLKKFGFPASFFIYLDKIKAKKIDKKYPARWIGKKDLRDFNLLKYSIQSHSLTHSRMDLLIESETEVEYNNRVYSELVKSNMNLHRILGLSEKPDQVFAFAFPYGNYNIDLAKKAFSAGYKLLLSTSHIDADVRKNRKVIGRYTIDKRISIEKFKKIVKIKP
jgi:peptidoglycan/xylan/chitin deacetylase (PgdA/CDA1 family)